MVHGPFTKFVLYIVYLSGGSFFISISFRIYVNSLADQIWNIISRNDSPIEPSYRCSVRSVWDFNLIWLLKYTIFRFCRPSISTLSYAWCVGGIKIYNCAHIAADIYILVLFRLVFFFRFVCWFCWPLLSFDNYFFNYEHKINAIINWILSLNGRTVRFFCPALVYAFNDGRCLFFGFVYSHV